MTDQEAADRALVGAGFVLIDVDGRVVSAVPDGSGADGLAAYVRWRKGGSEGPPPSGIEVVRRDVPRPNGTEASGGASATLELIQVEGSMGWSDVREESLATTRRTLCHDLNNPLAAILGAADLMLLMGVPEEVRREVERVIEQAERMTAVVRRFAMPDDQLIFKEAENETRADGRGPRQAAG